MKLNVNLSNSSQTDFLPDIILMTFTILGGNELKCPSFVRSIETVGSRRRKPKQDLLSQISEF